MPGMTEAASARKQRFAALALSAALHTGVIFFGSAVLFQPARYGVEAGGGGLEVYLVAAPARPRSGEGREENREEVLPPTAGEPEEEMIRLQPDPAPPAPAAEISGDGSSPVPGRDPTTLFAAASARAGGTPGLRRNPAPPYPPAARRLGQEGIVLLRIAVNSAGRPTDVAVQRSSGYPLLDESALKTVRKWKFQPARAAGLPRASVTRLRVNFVLKENEE